eukprot:14136063-Alexandrium_andersonii.AAC.1
MGLVAPATDCNPWATLRGQLRLAALADRVVAEIWTLKGSVAPKSACSAWPVRSARLAFLGPLHPLCLR